MKADVSLDGFASMVNAAIERIDGRGRFGNRKVFVSAIWFALNDSQRRGWTLAGFKARLFEVHRAQLVALARADLVAAMPPDAVAVSQIEVHGATFHFVLDHGAREAWA